MASDQSDGAAHGKPRTQHTHVSRHRHHERQRATTPLNETAIDRGQPDFSREKTAYRSDMRPTARPETHQNLIHPDKEQNRRLMTINAAAMVLLKNNAATIS